MIKTSQPKSELLIRKTAGVCGGEACIRNTRIPVWVLVSLKRQGIQNSDLLRNYPDLNLDTTWRPPGVIRATILMKLTLPFGPMRKTSFHGQPLCRRELS